MFTHEKAGFPQTNEESPPFFVYRIKSRFSVKRRNPNPSPTWKIKFGFLSFGPSGESRTHGLLNPIQARYQTALHPDVTHCDGYYYTPLNCQMSTFSFTKMQNDCFVPPGWAILNAYNSRFNLSANPPVRHSAVFSKFADFSVHKKSHRSFNQWLLVRVARVELTAS